MLNEFPGITGWQFNSCHFVIMNEILPIYLLSRLYVTKQTILTTIGTISSVSQLKSDYIK